MIRKGTGSLRDQNRKPLKNNNSEKMDNGYERNQKLQGSQPNTKQRQDKGTS
jgi:hypothetical protein